MKKAISLLCSGALASATLLSPIAAAPAQAGEDMTARAYFSLKFGSGAPVENNTQYGLQFKRSLDNDDRVVDPFAPRRSMTVFDLAMDGEGLAKANILGLDTIKAYDLLTGKERYNLGFGNPFAGPNGVYLALGIVGLIGACFGFEWDLCDDDDNNGGGGGGMQVLSEAQ